MKFRIFFLVLIVLFLTAGFVPATINSFLTINATFTNVYQSLNNPGNWLKWQPELKKDTSAIVIKKAADHAGFKIVAPSVRFFVQKKGLAEFDIVTAEGLTPANYNYTIVADSSVLKTDVYCTRKSNIFGLIRDFLNTDKPGGGIIEQLKIYLESPLLYYGYQIEKQITRDRQLIIKRKTVLKGDVFNSNKMVFKELKSVAAQNNLTITAPMQLQYLSALGDSVQVIMGLPVNKKLVTPGGVDNMGMPGGKVLVGSFKGSYKDRKKLYQAMQLYLNDNYLHTQTLPLEKFNDNKLPDNDDSIVDMQVMIPYL